MFSTHLLRHSSPRTPTGNAAPRCENIPNVFEAQRPSAAGEPDHLLQSFEEDWQDGKAIVIIKVQNKCFLLALLFSS